jgi:hypothetical protein
LLPLVSPDEEFTVCQPMPDDPAHHLNLSKSRADFTYTITVKQIEIHDTGKGAKSVVFLVIVPRLGYAAATCAAKVEDEMRKEILSVALASPP